MENFMNKFKKIGALTGLCFLVLACNFNTSVSFTDEKTEKENAESTAALLYLYISQNNYEKVPELFSDSFFKTDSKEKLTQTLIKTNEILGQFQDYRLEQWKTQRTKGSGSKTEYLLIYKVKYSKFEAIEALSLVKEGEFIKIIGYNINSDGFINSNAAK